MSVVVITFYVVFYNKIFALTFDENFATASKMNVTLYNILISIVVAIVIVLSMNQVGSLLITALIVFPVLTAMQIFTAYRHVVLYSALISVIGSVVGILVSILISTPVGSTIVVIDGLFYILHIVIGKLKGNK